MGTRFIREIGDTGEDLIKRIDFVLAQALLMRGLRMISIEILAAGLRDQVPSSCDYFLNSCARAALALSISDSSLPR